MNHLFSIILPTFNRSVLITKAIESVINQTYTNWELIIIDDGSTDNTKSVLENYLSDSRIKYFFQENQERSVARNNGIKRAKGDYICFLDSDDEDYSLSYEVLAVDESSKEMKTVTEILTTLDSEIDKHETQIDTLGNYDLFNYVLNNLCLTFYYKQKVWSIILDTKKFFI